MRPIVKHVIATSVLTLCLEGATLLALKPASAEEIIIKGAPFREAEEVIITGAPIREVVSYNQGYNPNETVVQEHFVPAHRNWHGAFVPGHYVLVQEHFVPAHRNWYGAFVPGHYAPI